MKRGLLLLLSALLLAGCAAKAPRADTGTGAPDIPAPVSQTPASESHASEPPAAGAPALSELPDEAAAWTLSDFAPQLCAGSAAEERYAIAEGTEWENTLVVRRGAAEGPSIYVIGGIHGDEIAGWTAANLLKQLCPRAGSVYILSPANVYGAENEQRKTRSERDLNRNFPGDAEGWDAERIAASIYADIADKRPDLVLDLHETKGPQANAPESDDLRNTIIVYDIAPIGELVWELTADGELTLLGSPPEGSVNRTVSTLLEIPVITLETWRGEALPLRVSRQLQFAEAVLSFYGML